MFGKIKFTFFVEKPFCRPKLIKKVPEWTKRRTSFSLAES